MLIWKGARLGRGIISYVFLSFSLFCIPFPASKIAMLSTRRTSAHSSREVNTAVHAVVQRPIPESLHVEVQLECMCSPVRLRRATLPPLCSVLYSSTPQHLLTLPSRLGLCADPRLQRPLRIWQPPNLSTVSPPCPPPSSEAFGECFYCVVAVSFPPDHH
ncbi:hypothetical protein B0H21DRAFT_585820 [Amylocystis lapponica]|nr:hypothetical protein B0H21DRAFT_585820 [Amylocystis lapponica]